jgi:hypothetical protein
MEFFLFLCPVKKWSEYREQQITEVEFSWKSEWPKRYQEWPKEAIERACHNRRRSYLDMLRPFEKQKAQVAKQNHCLCDRW